MPNNRILRKLALACAALLACASGARANALKDHLSVFFEMEPTDSVVALEQVSATVLKITVADPATGQTRTLKEDIGAKPMQKLLTESNDLGLKTLHWSPPEDAAPNLPDDPSAEQVDAWVEIAELVGDPGFRQRIRQVMDLSGQLNDRDGQKGWLEWAHENAVAAVLRGCPPDSAEAGQVVSLILEPVLGEHPVGRGELVAGLEVATDPRIDRYWQLTAIINGWPPFPSHMQADLWLLAALRAHG